MYTLLNTILNGSTRICLFSKPIPSLRIVQTHNSRLSLSTYGETNRDRGQKAETNYYTYSTRARAQYGRSCENKRTNFKLTERPKSSKQCRFGAGGQQSLARVVIANISLATNHPCRTLPPSIHIKLQNSPQCILNCRTLPQCILNCRNLPQYVLNCKTLPQCILNGRTLQQCISNCRSIPQY